MMLNADENYDIAQEFSENWNKKLKSLRIAGILISIVMLVLSVLLIAFPAQSVKIIVTIASLLILLLGVFQIFDYFSLPVMVRHSGILISSILNIMIGILLLAAPKEGLVSAFSFLFGLTLLAFGIDKITFAGKLGFFSIHGFGWMIASGILDVVAFFFFLFAPFLSAVALTYILAFYLLFGGITLLVESFSVKNIE